MPVLPLATPIKHAYWAADGGTDYHGNPTGAYGPLIDEMIVAWWPLERRTWEIDPVDPDVVARIENDIHLLVDRASNFNKPDLVQVNQSASQTNPNWLTYQVEGMSTNWSAALPFPAASYGMLIGAEVHCRRVTSTAVLGGR